MFSSRLQADLAPNRLAAALERVRADNRPFVDFTQSNPTRAGLAYPEDLLAPLGDRRGLIYSPEPFGASEARRAVAADYARRDLAVEPERIVLTASTSEAYSLLFKVLCDAGDEVLVPRPSYPLFEHLTRLDDVAVKLYDLEYHGSWRIDVESVGRALGPRARALLIVTPNNPTGSFVKRDEFEKIAALCAERQVAIVADEVFADYELIEGASAAAARVLTRAEGLLFSLGGLSKSVGLPQAKIGWMAVAGSDQLVRDALGRLELACDSYLSVSTPVQLALPELLGRGATIRAQIQARVAANYRSLVERAAQTPSCDVLRKKTSSSNCSSGTASSCIPATSSISCANRSSSSACWSPRRTSATA